MNAVHEDEGGGASLEVTPESQATGYPTTTSGLQYYQNLQVECEGGRCGQVQRPSRLGSGSFKGRDIL